MLRSISLLLTINFAANSIAAEPGAVTSALAPRQDPWWPYGPYSQWGVANAPGPSTDTPPALIPTTANAVLTTAINAPTTGLSLDVAATSLLTAPALSTAAASTANTAAMTTITALPPATTPSRRYRRPGSSDFNVAFLSPVFALAGAILGALLAWLVIRYLRRRKGLWEPHLKAGPPYAPAMVQTEDSASTSETASQATSEAFLGRGRPSRRTTTNSRFSRAASKRSSNWLVRALSAHQREPATDSDAELGNQSISAAHEDDPFLVPPGTESRRASTPAHGDPTRFEFLRTPDALLSDEELDAAPWDTLRHKSIRRDILARLRGAETNAPQHRRGHTRSDSDVTLETARAGPSANSPVRGRSLARVHSDATGSSASTSSPGFRIVDDDPERTSILGLEVRLPWRTKSARRTDDHLTALPPRSRSRSPAAASRIVELLGSPATPSRVFASATPPALPRVDSSVLPASPPRIASPPLEAQLFFAPLGAFGSVPMLALSDPSASRSPEPEKGQQEKPVQPHKRLHATRAPPQLPFPSSPQYARTPRRLRKAPLRTSEDKALRLVSPPPARTQPEVSIGDDKHGALDKVGEILAQSYSARDLRGEQRVRSPTMFGAVM